MITSTSICNTITNQNARATYSTYTDRLHQTDSKMTNPDQAMQKLIMGWTDTKVDKKNDFQQQTGTAAHDMQEECMRQADK